MVYKETLSKIHLLKIQVYIVHVIDFSDWWLKNNLMLMIKETLYFIFSYGYESVLQNIIAP
jgi:hypothetical protein